MFRSFCVFCAWMVAAVPVLQAQPAMDLGIRLLAPSAGWVNAVAAQAPATPGQVAPVPKLFIKILDGEGAVNNIKARTAREPVVEVDDENHKPVAGAAVAFLAPHSGAGGTFAGQPMFQTVTDASGRAVGRGFMPNHTAGHFNIEVTATLGAEVAKATISEMNEGGAGGSSSNSVGTTSTHFGILSGKGLLLLSVVAAGAAAGVVVATHSSTPTATITAPTTVTVGPTH